MASARDRSARHGFVRIAIQNFLNLIGEIAKLQAG